MQPGILQHGGLRPAMRGPSKLHFRNLESETVLRSTCISLPTFSAGDKDAQHWRCALPTEKLHAPEVCVCLS